MHSLPLFLRVRDRQVLVVGGGMVALRRVRLLRRAGARIRLVAPDLVAGLRELADGKGVTHRARTYRSADLEGCWLAFAATDDAGVNAVLLADARAAGIWAQRVDESADSDFHVPAVIDRSPLLVALTSGGAAPVLTRLLRVRLESLVPAGYARLAELVARFRPRAAVGRDRRQRRRFWDAVLAGPIVEQVLAGRETEAARDLDTLLDAGAEPEITRGEVYLVGGGPGDPDLLTFRALRLMQQADVVLYDSLVAPAILDLTRADAERIHVGKRADRHSLAQENLNALMVREARAGRRVLRLKGGDPFVFGRGGEEIAQLADAGIPFQVVPGVTAANGCAAYAGIPLTHRDYAQSVTFVTGHGRGGEPELDWRSLAAPAQTVVFFMARRNLGGICRRLIEHGLPTQHPAALVEEGTTPRQRVIVGDLGNLPQRVAEAGVAGASLVIVGEVVRLNTTLGWFAQRGRVSRGQRR